MVSLSAADLGEGTGVAHPLPPPPMRWPAAFWYNWYSVLKYVYVTSQLRQYLVVHPLPPKKNPVSGTSAYYCHA